MFIEKISKSIHAEFPGFDLVGYSDLCIPMFRRELQCSFVSKERLPVVDEFVFRYSLLEIDLDDIGKIMGLPYDLIEQSWMNILHLELIDRFNKLTERGNKYLEKYKLDNFEITDINVVINGLTGEIELDNSSMVSSKALRESGLKSVKPLIEPPNIENIDIRSLKMAVKKLRKPNEEGDQNELVGINHVTVKTTSYKRLSLFVFADKQANHRFMVYDGWQRMTSYEGKLNELEIKGSKILKVNMSNYSNSFKPHLIIQLAPKINNLMEINMSMIFEEWDQLIKGANSKILLSVPLVDLCDLQDNVINNLMKCAENGISVEIYVTGREFTNSFQKKQYEALINKKNISIRNSPYYNSKVLIVDNKVCIISDFKRTELNLPCSKEAYAEYGYKILDANLITEVKKSIENDIIEYPHIPEMVNKEWVNNRLKNIIRLFYQFDEELRSINGVGWLADEPVPDTQKLLDSPLATNEIQFKEILNSLNKSFVESIENVWNRNNLKNYFWNEFKNNYTGLQRALHKIKLYRHSTHHLSLDDKNKPTYNKFLDEDLNGSIPMFVNEGYKRIQIKLLESLENELRELCN